MELASAIAICGIWLGVGISGLRFDSAPITALFATFATLFVVM